MNLTLSGLNAAAQIIHEGNKQRGFYDTAVPIVQSLALINCEVCEAIEADREGRRTKSSALAAMQYHEVGTTAGTEIFKAQIKDTLEDEIADVFIRVLDFVAYHGIDLEQHVNLKLQFNATRAQRHGKKY